MAISFIGSAVDSASPNQTVSVTLPGGMATDDLIIVAAAVGDTANNGMAAPTEGGYTRIGAATIYSNDVADVNLDLYYKFHNGTDTTVSFDAVGGTNASNAAVVMVFRGVKLVADGGPFDTAVSTTSGINSSDADPPSHDWSGAAGVWTVLAAATGHTGGVTASFTFPTGYTTNADQRAHNDTTDVLVGMGYNTSPSDPEDPGALTAANIGTAGDNAWAAVTMSLSPAAASATRGLISWAEQETPFAPTRGLVSWAEQETPLVPTRGLVSWVEVETPIAPTRGLVAWAEVEAPLAPTRGLIGWVEQEVADVVSPTRGLVSWGEQEVADPPSPTRGLASWVEFEVVAAPTRGLISWAEQEVVDIGGVGYEWMTPMTSVAVLH